MNLVLARQISAMVLILNNRTLPKIAINNHFEYHQVGRHILEW